MGDHETKGGTHVPIFAMTAEAMKGDAEACLDAGMDAYLAKSIRANRLFQLIGEHVGMANRVPAKDSGEISTSTTLDSLTPRACDAQPITNSASFDWTDALRTVDGNHQLLARIVSAFLGQYPTMMENLLRAFQDQDSASLHLHEWTVRYADNGQNGLESVRSDPMMSS